MHLATGGMGLGILVMLLISPEFYRRHDRGAYVNQSMKPTAPAAI